MIFKDRYDAGRKLAIKLEKYKDKNPIIVALPRGGVVVGFEIAKFLRAQLDILVARKISSPIQPEFGIGAIAPNDVKILDPRSISAVGISHSLIDELIKTETIEMERRSSLYRQDLPVLDLNNRIVIVVDDGLATGVTARAAIASIKKQHPAEIVLAIPVAPVETLNSFVRDVDKLVCLHTPTYFGAVGAFYENFKQVNDEEVINLISLARKNHASL